MSVANKFSSRATARWTLAATLAVVLVGSFMVFGTATVARAADDDEEEDTADTKFMRSFLTNLGLRQGNEPGIDYHERSPLVVPPTRELPKPQADSAAVNNPAWPKDPDIQQKRKVKRERKNTVAAEEEEMRPLSPGELNAQRRRTASNSPETTGSVPNPDATRAQQMTPNQLGFTGFSWNWKSFWDKEGTVVPFEKEPDRTSLTDPPAGLRTPSPKYQYGSKNKLEATREIGTDQAVGVK